MSNIKRIKFLPLITLFLILIPHFVHADEIDRLLKQLRHSDPIIRASSAEFLGKVGDKRAIYPLISALNDKNEKVRFFSAQALMYLGDTSIEAPLISYLNDESPTVRLALVQTLIRLDSNEALIPFSELMQRENSDNLEFLIFQYFKKKRAIKVLINLVKDGSIKHKRKALFVLSQLKDDSAFKDIVDLLNSKDEKTELMAVWALGELRDREGTSELVKLLINTKGKKRLPIIRALGKLRSKASVKYLIRLLRDRDFEIRRTSVWALGEIRDFNALNPLSNKLFDDIDEGVRANTAAALGNFKHDKIFTLLIQALEDENSYVRLNAMCSLVKLNQKESVGTLLTLTYDKDPMIRSTAIKKLGSIKDIKNSSGNISQPIR